jgi:hypothetical protein
VSELHSADEDPLNDPFVSHEDQSGQQIFDACGFPCA